MKTQVIIQTIYDDICDNTSLPVYAMQGIDDESLPICTYTIVSYNIEKSLSCDVKKLEIQINFFGDKQYGFDILRAKADVFMCNIDGSTFTVSDTTQVLTGDYNITNIKETIDNETINIRHEYSLSII